MNEITAPACKPVRKPTRKPKRSDRPIGPISEDEIVRFYELSARDRYQTALRRFKKQLTGCIDSCDEDVQAQVTLEGDDVCVFTIIVAMRETKKKF